MAKNKRTTGNITSQEENQEKKVINQEEHNKLDADISLKENEQL